MSKEIKRLKNCIDSISFKQRLSQSDVVRMLSVIRQYLEKKKIKGKYPQLNFFCNWVLHTELSDSSVCYRMLEKIGDAYLLALGDKKIHEDSSETPQKFIDKVSDFFAINVLRKELILLFRILDLPLYLFGNQKNWQQFSNALIQELLEKPIKYPNYVEQRSNLASSENKVAVKDNKQLRDGANGKIKRIVRELSIISGRGDFSGVYCWEVKITPNISLVGKLLWSVSPDEFDIK